MFCIFNFIAAYGFGIANVPGRIIFLIVPMHTMNGIRIGVVPWGTRCANVCLVLLIRPKLRNPTHKGKANGNVIVKCLVLAKCWSLSDPEVVLVRGSDKE